MLYWPNVLALSCQILDFVCEFQDSPAKDTRVSAHDTIEGSKRLGACVKVKCPVTIQVSDSKRIKEESVLSNILSGPVSLHPLRESLGAPGINGADDTALVHDVEGRLADELADVLVGWDVCGYTEHLVERHWMHWDESKEVRGLHVMVTTS